MLLPQFGSTCSNMPPLPQINLIVKLDRNPSSAEQSIVLLRGGAKVLSTRYSRANRDVSMELVMFDKKHFQVRPPL